MVLARFTSVLVNASQRGRISGISTAIGLKEQDIATLTVLVHIKMHLRIVIHARLTLTTVFIHLLKSVKDDQVDQLVSELADRLGSELGGKIFVADIPIAVDLRTKKTGEDAI
jgi:nitrogen regulatory protein PII